MPQLLSSILNGGVTPGVSGTGARFSYALLSYSPANSVGGMTFFDSNFSIPINIGYYASYNSSGASNTVYLNSSTNQNYSYIGNWLSDTNTYPSSSSTSNYMNGTNMQGEFGNASMDVYSDGTFARAQRTSGSNYNKLYLNTYAINSDHSNKRLVYLITNGTIFVVDRLYGTYNAPLAGTSAYTISSLNTSMTGSASYNYARKELTILSYNSSGGSYNVITYQNVDFNLYPDPSVALTQSGVVRVNSTVSLSSSWAVNNNESYYNLKPVVTANGTVYVVVFFTSSSFALYSFTRSGTSAITGTYVTALSVTTTYGQDQALYYGTRQITSRDGTSVAVFCPYYYYGAGIECFMIDKAGNTYSTYSNTDSNYGYSIVPYQNNGWAFAYNGNGYASNWSGSYIYAIFVKASAGGFTQISSSPLYYPTYPNPNTTNYPPLTMTTDYMLLSGNLNGPKLAG
jgi:hypothetical protein